DNADQANLDDDAAGDACDDDDDDDGVDDGDDNCPLVFNDQLNSDSDSDGDACDDDDDNDTVLDVDDNCPLKANTNQANIDGDVLGDKCDDDDDNDGEDDGDDNCPEVANGDQLNSDTDNDGDACDDDDDDDTVLDVNDNCPITANTQQLDNDGDDFGDECDDDDDNDGEDDDDDNCPLTFNDQLDSDSDNLGDVCDDDDDADTVLDVNDNCPLTANLAQDDLDQDLIGDECDDDDDDDGVLDTTDNCPVLANSDQVDTDEDAAGDECDADDDGDGLDDFEDNCPLDENDDQLDQDNDAIGDVCDDDIDDDTVKNDVDNCPMVANANQEDGDADGFGDACDSSSGGSDTDSAGDTDCPKTVGSSCSSVGSAPLSSLLIGLLGGLVLLGRRNSRSTPGPAGPTVPPSHFLSTSEQKGDSLDFRRHWQAPASTEVLDSPLLCAVGRDSSTGNLCFESASVALRPRNKMGHLIPLTTLLILALSVSPANAQDRYVTPGASDTGDCTDSQSPCGTIKYAVGLAGAGDTIFVDSGTYTATTSFPIKVYGQNIIGEGASITKIVPSVASPNLVLDFDSTATAELKGLAITGITGDNIAAVRFSHGQGSEPFDLSLSDLRVSNNSGNGIEINGTGGAALELTVKNSTLNSNIDGLVINWDYGPTNVTLTGNTIANNSEYGLVASMSGTEATPCKAAKGPSEFIDRWTVADNHVYGNGSTGMYVQWDDRPDIDLIVQGNTFSQNGYVGFFVDDSGTWGISRLLVKENEFLGNGYAGLWASWSDQEFDGLISGNTFSNNNTGTSSTSSAQLGLSFGSSNYGRIDLIGNTIVDGGTNGVYYLFDSYNGIASNIEGNTITGNARNGI
ncbi:MAG: DUF1565 domain-containing protein, partial [Proteobacteria bacterium]|nr:DUF1565 domain-containing protein [Pseudomonadota bacterium]